MKTTLITMKKKENYPAKSDIAKIIKNTGESGVIPRPLAMVDILENDEQFLVFVSGNIGNYRDILVSNLEKTSCDVTIRGCFSKVVSRPAGVSYENPKDDI